MLMLKDHYGISYHSPGGTGLVSQRPSFREWLEHRVLVQAFKVQNMTGSQLHVEATSSRGSQRW